MADLELVDTDTLIKELVSRFDTIIFAGMRDMDEENNKIERHFEGSPNDALALTVRLKRDILEEESR